MSDDDDFVTIAKLNDPVFAEMALDLLAKEGIQATAPGVNHGALFGQMAAWLDVSVQVPKSQAARARELLETLEERGQIVDDAPEARELELEERTSMDDADERALGDGPYRRPATEPRRDSPRMKRVAAFLSLAISFGTGHFYVRQGVAGGVLLLAQLGVFVLAAGGRGAVMAAIPLLMLIDLVGSVRGAADFNEGRTFSGNQQMMRTLPLAVLSIAFAMWVLPAVAEKLAPPEEPGYPALQSPEYLDSHDYHRDRSDDVDP